MGKKCKCPPEGAPEWMVTYGDMMTLLMCFFVLLVAMSVITETKLIAALGSFKAHLGFLPQNLRVLAILKNTNVARKIEEQKEEKKDRDAKEKRVTAVRAGQRIVLGTKALFKPGSATLNPEAKPKLLSVAYRIRGIPNVLMISGHTSSSPILVKSQYPDNWSLSWHRAMAVARFMMNEGDIAPYRIRTMAASHYDPVAGNLDEPGQKENRRVEIFVSDKVARPDKIDRD